MNEPPLSMNKHKLHKQAHNRSCFLNGGLNTASPAYPLHCISGHIPASTDQSHLCIWVLFRFFPCCLDMFSITDWAVTWQYTPLKELSWNLNNFRIHSSITKWTCSWETSEPSYCYTTFLKHRKLNCVQTEQNHHTPGHAHRKEEKKGEGDRERERGLLSPLYNSQLRPYRWQNSPNQCFTGSTMKKPAQWEAAIKKQNRNHEKKLGCIESGQKRA